MAESVTVLASGGQVRVVARNTASSIATKAGTLVGTLAFTALLSRYAGAAGFGQYAYALSVASLLGMLVQFGLDQVAIRDLAQGNIEPAEMFGQTLVIQAGLAALCSTGIVLLAAQVGMTTEMKLVILAVSVQVFLEAMNITLISLFRARERMEYEAAVTWLWCALLVALTGLGVYLHLSLPILLGLAGLSYAVRLGAVYCLIRYHFCVVGILKWVRPRRTLVAAALPFVGMTWSSMLYNMYPRLMIGHFFPAREIGLYAAAERIVQLLVGLFIVVDMVVFPVFAKQIQISRQKFAMTYRFVADAFMVGGLLVGLVLAAFAKEMIMVLYGAEFAPSLAVLVLLIPTISMGIPGFVSTRALIALRRERLLALWTGAMVSLGIGVTWFSAPRWELVGVAAGWAFPIALGFVFFFIFIRRELRLPWATWPYAIYFSTFAGAFAVSYLVHTQTLVVRLVTHAVLIAGLSSCYLLSGLVRMQDVIDLVQSLVRSKKNVGVVQS